MILNFIAEQNQFFFIGFGIITVWIAILTVLIIQMLRHYQSLTKGVSKKDLKTVLDEWLKANNQQTKTIEKVEKALTDLEREGTGHLQKIGFLRFNPFADTGGDQSFILSLLDEQDNGVIISSLHGRGTTRVYAKQIAEGKGKELELSEEEKKVIKQAKKLK